MTSQTHCCPACGETTDITFEVRDPRYMLLDGELIALADLPCRLYCACGWQLDGVLHDAVIDMRRWKVTAGQFVATDK